MRKGKQLFTQGERRVAGLALLSAIVLTLSMLALEPMFRPSLGLYDMSSLSAPSMPNVIDARPMA
ncbi:MAG: hypothetical protein V4701_03710 [Pseudomonadota bacterium]